MSFIKSLAGWCVLIFLVFLLAFLSDGAKAYDNKDVLCLATTIYKEAANQGLSGQVAVGSVVLNRVGHSSFPDTVCGVVKQKSQFSWYQGGKISKYANLRDSRFGEAVVIAHSLLQAREEELYNGNVGRAMFFHADYVSPQWKNVKRVKKIGNHVFYKLKEM